MRAADQKKRASDSPCCTRIRALSAAVRAVGLVTFRGEAAVSMRVPEVERLVANAASLRNKPLMCKMSADQTLVRCQA